MIIIAYVGSSRQTNCVHNKTSMYKNAKLLRQHIEVLSRGSKKITKVRVGDSSKSKLGHLYVGQLHTWSSASGILYDSLVRSIDHKNRIKRQIAFPRYMIDDSAIGKLDFWKQVVHQVYSGKKPQPEPLSICLQDAVLNNPLTMGYFTRLMNVRAQEINKRTMSSMTEMRQMADDSKSTLLALTL